MHTTRNERRIGRRLEAGLCQACARFSVQSSERERKEFPCVGAGEVVLKLDGGTKISSLPVPTDQVGVADGVSIERHLEKIMAPFNHLFCRSNRFFVCTCCMICGGMR